MSKLAPLAEIGDHPDLVDAGGLCPECGSPMEGTICEVCGNEIVAISEDEKEAEDVPSRDA